MNLVKGLLFNILSELRSFNMILETLEKTFYDENKKKISNIKDLHAVIASGKTKSPMMIFVYVLMVNFIRSFGFHQSNKFFLTYQSVKLVSEFSKNMDQLEEGFQILDDAETNFNARRSADCDKEMKKVENGIDQWLLDFDNRC